MFKKVSILVAVISLFTFSGCSNSIASQTIKNTEPNKVALPKSAEPVKVKETAPVYEFTAPFKKSGEGIPVLMFHSIAYEKGNGVRLPTEKFDEDMKYLKDNGYHTLTLGDLYNYLQYNGKVPEKSVVLTFDDGYMDNYTNMYPILKKYGFRATIFVITSYIDKSPDYLTSNQLKEMDTYGIDIESHTVDHEPLNKLTKDKQLEELTNSKIFLEKLLNKKILYIAYPYGAYDKNVAECAKEAGYTMAFTTKGRWSMKKNGMFTLDRVYISSLHDINVFTERITNPNYPSLPN